VNGPDIAMGTGVAEIVWAIAFGCVASAALANAVVLMAGRRAIIIFWFRLFGFPLLKSWIV
jgi:hypothetical protein